MSGLLSGYKERDIQPWRSRHSTVQVQYLPCATVGTAAPKECRASCDVCSPSLPLRDVGESAAFMSSSRRCLAEEGWVQRQVGAPSLCFHLLLFLGATLSEQALSVMAAHAA